MLRMAGLPIVRRGSGNMGIPFRESAMWKCQHCGLEVMFSAVQPEIDDEGCYFVCPGCDGRNKLVNVGPRDGDHIALAQP